MTQTRHTPHGARAVILRLLAALAGRATGQPLLAAASLRRVLLIRHDRLGDAVISTPIIEALHTVAPGVEIDVLASPANAAFFRHDPRISHVWVWGGSFLNRLGIVRACRRRSFDATLQLVLGQTTLPALLSAILTPKGRTIGQHVVGHERLFDHAVDTAAPHFADRTYLVFANGFAFDHPIERPGYSIPISNADRIAAHTALSALGIAEHTFVMLNISSGTADRELPDELNAELARRIGQLGYTVVVMGAPEAGERVAAIATSSGATALATPSLGVAVAAIAMARVIVTPDTSIVHIASATSTPTVALYTPAVNQAGWGPLGVAHRSITAPSSDTSTLSPQEITDAVMELLGTN